MTSDICVYCGTPDTRYGRVTDIPWLLGLMTTAGAKTRAEVGAMQNRSCHCTSWWYRQFGRPARPKAEATGEWALDKTKESAKRESSPIRLAAGERRCGSERKRTAGNGFNSAVRERDRAERGVRRVPIIGCLCRVGHQQPAEKRSSRERSIYSHVKMMKCSVAINDVKSLGRIDTKPC